MGPGTRSKAKRPGGAEAPARPIVGVVVAYSETADQVETGERPELGVVYPLREGEVLFVGRQNPPGPAVIPIEGGEKLRVTHSHLFAFARKFEYVSRVHLALEMKADGRTVLTDFSTNGIYLVTKKELLQRPREKPYAVHTLEGRQTIFLGVSPEQVDPSTSEVPQLEIIPLDRSGGAAVGGGSS